MRIAVLGRSSFTLNTAKGLAADGFSLGLIATAKAAEYYATDPRDFEDFAREVDAAFLVSTTLNSEKALDLLQASGCELAVSVNWPTIIGKAAFAAFPLGILNAHAGDLPRYRGNACPNWAIINGEERVGLCIHYMVPGELDSGPVLVREHLPLSEETYIGDVYAWMEERIPKMFIEAVRNIQQGTAVAEEQSKNPLDTLRCYPRRSEDSRIDWKQSSEIIHRLVRASAQPFAGAYTTLENQQVIRVWRAGHYRHEGPYLAMPGQIMMRSERGIVVACGEGCIKLEYVSIDNGPSGEEAMSVIRRSLRARLV